MPDRSSSLAQEHPPEKDAGAIRHAREDATGSVHENLEGAKGRRVYFRPERYGPDVLEPMTSVVLLRSADGAERRFPVRDISQSGVAFSGPACPPLEEDDLIDEVRVLADRHELYHGAAQVSSKRVEDGVEVYGLSFVGSLLDIDDLLRLADIQRWRASSAESQGVAGRPWFVAGHERFKSLVAELTLFCDDAERDLARLEDALPWHVVHGDSDAAARAALIELLDDRFVTPFLDYAARIDSELRSATRAEWKALKAYSLRHLDRHCMQAPSMLRARQKPFGYSGDFQVMRFIYGLYFEGRTLHAKAMNLAALRAPAAQAVRARKDAIKGQLHDLVTRQSAASRPLRIASVAAGPAQEVFEFLSDFDDFDTELDIVLVDQAKGALAFAYRRLKQLAATRGLERVRIAYLHDSVRRLIEAPRIFRSFGPFDAIVCAGLVDYLRPEVVVPLFRSYYESLAPGGEAFVGNMVPTNPTRWLMEHHMDWYLLYRTRDELREMGERAVPSAQLELLEDRTGINPFLRIKKT